MAIRSPGPCGQICAADRAAGASLQPLQYLGPAAGVAAATEEIVSSALPKTQAWRQVGSMSSKETILKSIRRNRPESSDLPELAHEWTTFDDRRTKFIEVLEAVGGAAIIARNNNELNEQLKRLPQAATAQRVASLVPGVGTPNVELDAAKEPNDLATVDIAIMAGDFAIAENAAVWVTDRNLKHRVLYFL